MQTEIGKATIGSRVIAAGIGMLLAASLMTTAQATTVRRAVIEDYQDILTPNDAGFTDFSGNMGTVNQDGSPSAEAPSGVTRAMRASTDCSGTSVALEKRSPGVSGASSV